MKWYSKYLSVFEKPFAEVPLSTVEEVSEKLEAKQCMEPLASVVIIAYNEEKRLMSCLWSLADTKTKYPIEIIGINNSSSDRTADVFDALGLTYFNEDKKSPGHARNRGQLEAKGKYYICIDADTMYPPDYIDMHIEQLLKPGVAATSSLWSYVPDKDFPRYWMYFYEGLRDIHLKIQSRKRPELCVRGMTFAYNINYGREVGYRLDIKRGEDGSMALGLKKYGKIKFIYGNKARVITSTATLRQDGSAMSAFTKRIVKSVKNVGNYFFSKNSYKDEDSNIVK